MTIPHSFLRLVMNDIHHLRHSLYLHLSPPQFLFSSFFPPLSHGSGTYLVFLFLISTPYYYFYFRTLGPHQFTLSFPPEPPSLTDRIPTGSPLSIIPLLAPPWPPQ